MNSLPKVVVSNSLTTADWNNTTLVTGDLPNALAALKEQRGKDIALFGSSNLTASLLAQDLVDELRVMVNPVLLGAGHSLLAGLASRVRLELEWTTTFRSGNVLLCYRPVSD
jgi:dihydrofolate reductase